MGQNTGKKRERIRIEERSSTLDAAGEQVTTWALVGDRAAERLETPGREIWTGRERSGRIPTVFKMRYPRDFAVVPRMRVVCESRVYDILSATDPTGLKVDMLLTCEELVEEPK